VAEALVIATQLAGRRHDGGYCFVDEENKEEKEEKQNDTQCEIATEEADEREKPKNWYWRYFKDAKYKLAADQERMRKAAGGAAGDTGGFAAFMRSTLPNSNDATDECVADGVLASLFDEEEEA
jgi:hypothetical protein